MTESKPLHILVLSQHFPPEVSAGASRFYELARSWVRHGHKVTVVTCVPNHPAGVVYPGYQHKWWQRETMDGIDVLRLWTYLAPNKGLVRRSLSYISYFVSAVVAAPFLPSADVLVSTSPQFLCGIAGYPVSRLRRLPWVLDIRDLWPDSIIAVGAMKPGPATKFLEVLERFAYRKAAHVVGVSEAFVPHFLDCGVSSNKITTITNGVDLARFSPGADATQFRETHGLGDKFVAAYVGTHGMAHQLETVLEAADRLRQRNDIAFVLVGDGAEREKLLAMRDSMKLDNVVMLPLVPRDQIPAIWAATDAAIVTLRPTPLFELVIPSKIFEAMAAQRPIILGVRGEAARIVADAECGLTFTPGDAAGLAESVLALANDPARRKRLGENGYQLAVSKYDRQKLATEYVDLLAKTINGH
ncbi:MAG: glycosyltransferase family 4 protein [Rhizobiales bacterium]|nr:glycosyltransferase family 4 protein [Hyphomicrobiales bacterium]